MPKLLDRSRLAVVVVVLLAIALSACGNAARREQEDRAATAKQMFDNYCKSAGVKIYRRVEGVEGVLLLKLRPGRRNLENQFVFDDPYGHDLTGPGYIESFLRGSYQAGVKGSNPGGPPHKGFRFVEAIDPADGVRYRYSGRLEEPWQTNKSYLQGYIRFVVDRAVAPGEPPRYGVTFEDLSTRQDREYWIAASALRVVDTRTSEVLAERIGYMYDPEQGSKHGFRSPWMEAANHACPSFYDRFPGVRRDGHAATWQSDQTSDFVESVLIPAN